MKYSKSTRGFYEPEIHGNNIPDDAVEITADRYAMLLEAQSAGKVITDDVDGYPVAIDPPPLSLDNCKATKNSSLSVECTLAISHGISSAVLGTAHTYPTKPQDQANLAALVLNAQVVGSTYAAKFWCADSAGAWARRMHTAEQLIALGQEVTAHVQAQQDHYEALLWQVAAASTNTEIETLTW